MSFSLQLGISVHRIQQNIAHKKGIKNLQKRNIN